MKAKTLPSASAHQLPSSREPGLIRFSEQSLLTVTIIDDNIVVGLAGRCKKAASFLSAECGQPRFSGLPHSCSILTIYVEPWSCESIIST